MSESDERQERGGVDEWMTTRMIPRPSDALDDGDAADGASSWSPSDLPGDPGADIDETTVPTPRPLPIPDDEQDAAAGGVCGGVARAGAADGAPANRPGAVASDAAGPTVTGAPPPSFFPANTGRMRPIVTSSAVMAGAAASAAAGAAAVSAAAASEASASGASAPGVTAVPSSILPRTASFERAGQSGRRARSASSRMPHSSASSQPVPARESPSRQPRMCYSSQYHALHAQ